MIRKDEIWEKKVAELRKKIRSRIDFYKIDRNHVVPHAYMIEAIQINRLIDLIFGEVKP